MTSRIAGVLTWYQTSIVVVLTGCLIIGCSNKIELNGDWSDVATIAIPDEEDYGLSPANDGKCIEVGADGLAQVICCRQVVSSNGTKSELVYLRLRPTDNGMEPDEEYAIDASPSGSNPCIATDGLGRTFVVWDHESSGNRFLFHYMSTDTGANWSESRCITSSAGGSLSAAAFDSQHRPHIVFRTREATRYVRLNHDGRLVERDLTLHSTWLVFTNQPSISIDESARVYVAWSNRMDMHVGEEVHYAYSPAFGDSWIGPGTLCNAYGSLAFNWRVALATDAHSGVFVAWDGIGLVRSTDGGRTWDTARAVTSGGNATLAAGDDGQLCLVYEQNGAVWYIESANRGISWSEPFRLSSESATGVCSVDIAIGPDGRST